MFGLDGREGIVGYRDVLQRRAQRRRSTCRRWASRRFRLAMLAQRSTVGYSGVIQFTSGHPSPSVRASGQIHLLSASVSPHEGRRGRGRRRRASPPRSRPGRSGAAVTLLEAPTACRLTAPCSPTSFRASARRSHQDRDLYLLSESRRGDRGSAERVKSVDPQSRTSCGTGNERLGFDSLVVATGSRYLADESEGDSRSRGSSS